jgi:excisionase family DNA binding protein
MIANLLSAKQVSEILNCSLPLVYKLVDAGKLQIVDISSGNSKKKGVRFTEEEIKRFIEDNSN